MRPHPTQPGPSELLHEPVGLLDEIEPESAEGQLVSEDVVQLARERLHRAALPRERDRINVVVEPPVQLRLGHLEPVALVDESTVGVQHHMASARVSARSAPPLLVAHFHPLEDSVNLRRSADEPTIRRQQALVAEVHDVVLQRVQIRTRALGDAPGGGTDELRAVAEVRYGGDARACDPGVVGRSEPVLVAQRGEPVCSPLRPPAVLHQETDVVVPHDRERVPAELMNVAIAGDEVVGGSIVPIDTGRLDPPAVDEGGGRNGVEFVDRGLNVVEAEGVDPVEGAERMPKRSLREVGIEVDVDVHIK